ncbi:serine hydrolase domain-containing protein [Zunongwangia endophytica]|uniref:Serine hydrolase domain-containing protein n=1 Tax=Zunongwangia endophytica TaxID=1808945 RepID=A0ABV8H619_9FLAO|nr:serine hydrolase domain-containing protein [Zunongwangia endophytica]MDN3594252.1 serine hydrolase domain-containing protein [Zunongwangia endophytica]
MSRKTSKNILRIGLALGTIISLFFVPWILLKAWLMPLPTTIQEQANEAIKLGFDGIIIYVDKKDSESEFYTAGYKNRATKVPADPNTLFKIASVSKLYKAVTVAKLVRERKLSLDKTLSDYLPELKNRIENADKITLRMMVEHRSGIPNYTDTYMYWAAPKETADENLALVLDLPAKFDPGDDYEYSNTNYLLIDRIINRVLGYDSFIYIQENILDPLDLNNTHGSIEDVDINNVMSGYYIGYEQDLKTDKVDSMVSTAEDVGKFIRALNDGSVFKDQKEKDIYSSIYRYNHTGLIPGYQTIAKYHDDIDAVVVQFTNTTNFDGYEWNLNEIVYNRIVKILRK